MKKTIASLAILAAFAAKSQDMIVKKDGSIVKAKVTEVSDDAIKYKKFDNPDGPTYSVAKSSITSINYANGEVEKFNATEESTPESTVEKSETKIYEDENMKRTIEAIAKDVGEQLMRNCANGKVDNSTTEIYWDAVFKDAITQDLNIPVIVKWKPKWTDGAGKWVKGKILVAGSGEKRWVYQNDNGLMFSSCAKTFRIK